MVMESTGPYWVPVFNILEGDLKVVLANPALLAVVKLKPLPA